MARERGLLNFDIAITCNEIGCPLVQNGRSGYLCSAKVVLDGYNPRTIRGRKSRVALDYGSQIPDRCPMGYDRYQR